jgi:hypothetical protein
MAAMFHLDFQRGWCRAALGVVPPTSIEVTDI